MNHLFLPSLAILTLLRVAPAAVAQDPPNAAAPSAPPEWQTVQSERTVQIIWDAGATPPDVTAVLAELFSAKGAGEVAARPEGRRPRRRRENGLPLRPRRVNRPVVHV